MSQCSTCQEFTYSFGRPHRCAPLWEAEYDSSCGGEPEWEEFGERHGHTAEAAAVNAGEAYDDDGDNSLLNSHDGVKFRVRLCGVDDASWEVFLVSAAPDIVYSAEEVKS